MVSQYLVVECPGIYGFIAGYGNRSVTLLGLIRGTGSDVEVKVEKHGKISWVKMVDLQLSSEKVLQIGRVAMSKLPLG